jgi:hypothetical protein
MSFAILPGVARATPIASAASAATVPPLRAVRTQWETGRAIPSMSEVSGASYWMW